MRWCCFVLLFSCWRSAFGRSAITTIDDAFPGDTRSSILYSRGWLAGSVSHHGRVIPDASRAHGGTWHDATADTDPTRDGTTPTFMEINFQGTGIDLRCIIANNKALLRGTGTKADYSFFLDTVPQNRDYHHDAGTTGDAFLYDTSVFSRNVFSNGSHTLKVLANGGFGVDGSVLLLFDYAIITQVRSLRAFHSLTNPTDPMMERVPPRRRANQYLQPPLAGQHQLPPEHPWTVLQLNPLTLTDNLTTITRAGVQSQGPTAATLSHSAPAHSSSFPSSPSATSQKSNIAAIVGGLGAGLLFTFFLLIVWLRRRRLRHVSKILVAPFPNPNTRRFRPFSLLRPFADTPQLVSRQTQKGGPNASVAPPAPGKREPTRPAQLPSLLVDPVADNSGSADDVEHQREMLAGRSVTSSEALPRCTALESNKARLECQVWADAGLNFGSVK
ncbi:hypothetical protein C8R43DRAFT_1156050 [Mycena crocata]|nr:hypothetical protein C8R43DRAFT_1156050 [Mycena crocata]